MQGTFRKGDVLGTAIPPKKVRRGDVVAFRHTEPDNSTRLVAHRVHSRTPEGFITRVDRISYTDKIPVLTRDLIDGVCFARRNGKERHVWGGLAPRSARYADIGKDIVKFLLDANGYDVLDLGIDVPPEMFVDKMKEYDPDVIALSGFLTLAFDAMKETIEKMRAAGLKESVKIMIGGGTIDERIVNYVGAHAYGDTAMDAVKLADEWIGG